MLVAGGLTAQHLAYSTHDWQRLTASGVDSSASWSDVKTPGDGLTYAVGSTWVDHTDHSVQFVQFSGVGGTGPGSQTQGPPNGPDGQGAIVAVLQVTDAQGGIQWQRFFHGDGGGLAPLVVTTTRGRSVSVWPGPTPEATRIAICGETFDQRLPPFAAGSPESGLTTGSSGYIAVYNGLGELRWNHLLFGHDPAASTVVTDISIRVEQVGGASVDVVTYCGTSTNGQFDPDPMGSGPTPLSPTANAFAAPTTGCLGVPYAAGDAANHPIFAGLPDLQSPSLNPDGIIGRLIRDNAAGTTTRAFHCIVGGYEADSLWGLAERDPGRFAVVGTTLSQGSTSGPIYFPVTRPYWLQPPAPQICFGAPNSFHHGVVAEFDVSLVPLGGPVLLVGSTLIGASAGNVQTHARDVTWQGGEYYIVGSTNDPNFTPGTTNPCGQAKGFLVAAADLTDPGRLWTQIYTPRLAGPCTASGLVGVAGWNEHPDHVSVFGWIQEQASGQKDLFVSTLFRDTTSGTPPFSLLEMRTHRFETDSNEFASAIDDNASFLAASAAADFSYGYDVLPLGEGGGGGLAADSLGRLTLVGSIRGSIVPGSSPPAFLPSDYPVTSTPAGRNESAALQGPDCNGVLTRIDMLPAGVCRSDGTGSCPGTGWAPTGNGGTTPACALSPFGSLLGSPAPALQRMLVDYEGIPAPSEPVSLIVDRPPQSSAVVLSAWHVSIPATTPVHFPDQDVYIWVPSVSTPTVWGTYSATGASLRESLGVFTQTGTFMVQYVCLLAQPLTGTPCTAPDLSWAVSPALVFTY